MSVETNSDNTASWNFSGSTIGLGAGETGYQIFDPISGWLDPDPGSSFGETGTQISFSYSGASPSYPATTPWRTHAPVAGLNPNTTAGQSGTMIP